MRERRDALFPSANPIVLDALSSTKIFPADQRPFEPVIDAAVIVWKPVIKLPAPPALDNTPFASKVISCTFDIF